MRAHALARQAHRQARPEPREQSSPLTARQRQIAALIARGLSNAEIARALFLTEGTVANHVEHILTRLGAANRAQIAAWAALQGLLVPESDEPGTGPEPTPF